MAEGEDLEMLAAEYALGTLEPAERATVAARRQREAALDAAIVAWESRLAPLLDTVPSISPPEGLFNGISARTGAPPAENERVVELSRRIGRWRLATGLAGAIAASLAVFVAAREVQKPVQPQSFVAVLQKDASSPAFLVSVDLGSRTLTVRPVAADQQPGKSYELWLVNEKLGAPKSLGVIRDAGFTVEQARLSPYPGDVVRDSALAVTLEPQGGSPSGLPTGPVLFSGKLVQATP